MEREQNNGNITFKQGRKKREELQLPILHFVVSDDWVDKLGHDAFIAWLKFYSWCDRSDERKNRDYDVVPRSFRAIMKELGVGTKKFYNSIIRPLWNYGLIDIEEYKDSSIKGNKPKNIVVYEYPQNDISKKTKPLEKVRDYDTEYSSEARKFALKGGRKPKTENENEHSGSFSGKQGVVSQGNRGWFPQESRGGFSGKPNNDSNSINNDSNDINNLSIKEREIPIDSKRDKKEKTEKTDRKTDLNDLISKVDLPTAITKPLMVHIDRLIEDDISIDDICDMYYAYKERLNEYQFGFILNNVLYETKGRIRSVKNLLHISIKNYMKDITETKNQKETHSEVVPEWFKELKKEEKQEKYNLSNARNRFSDIFDFEGGEFCD